MMLRQMHAQSLHSDGGKMRLLHFNGMLHLISGRPQDTQGADGHAEDGGDDRDGSAARIASAREDQTSEHRAAAQEQKKVIGHDLIRREVK